MTAAEQSAKGDGQAAAPKGCVRATAPDGTTPIWVKAPRPPGTHYRVKHQMWGHRLVRADTPDEAVLKYAEAVAPAEATNKTWLKQLREQCRVAVLPGSEPAPEPAAK
jgi:hypothetical protein